jgi:thiamine biosynthesis lipoprotein
MSHFSRNDSSINSSTPGIHAIGVKFTAMGGLAEVRLESKSLEQPQLESIAQLCADEVKRIEKKYSRYDPKSMLSLINQASGKHAVAIDQETHTLLEYAQTLYDNSSELFDITSGVLRRAWRFDQQTPPSLNEIEHLLPLVSWKLVKRDAESIYLSSAGMEIDFGGFGKEYAADRAALVLQQSGIENGFVNLSGDIRVIGPKINGEPYRMGIQHPREKNKLLATIPIHQGALATSGDYERYFEFEGARYCHILNPKTAQPVKAWQSVSVLAPLAIVAGSCSTCTMLLEHQGLDYLHSSGFSYLGVDSEGQIHQK